MVSGGVCGGGGGANIHCNFLKAMYVWSLDQHANIQYPVACLYYSLSCDTLSVNCMNVIGHVDTCRSQIKG